MRLVFECVECGSHYLPPEGMAYPDGPASPLWCARCQAVKQEAGIREDPLLARIALAAARATRTGAAPEESTGGRPDVRPSRPPLSRRARSGPGGVRGKLA
ncbi:hypothetical protein PUR61_14885 [Streptomyces sp. BE20]|uniref:hypothetical protein n=1 Tax=unclassified Streptomyces TaxID=2593676 RepID=UPI002E79AEBB|nr:MULTISPECIES: hypothetical protein [unclassified Streptomyces]MED7953771.1 hypothetical protein [Streptomyces sp. BE303]MEE1823466.1 hypothetical protein [Streptomyces sp. BE20]